jgi:2-oxoglutarate ferredoxin oxidoreductase subunit alpha
MGAHVIKVGCGPIVVDLIRRGVVTALAMNGATAAGMRAMTATSGPGFSLMQEGIGYSCMTEVPCIVVNVMRGGPATGLPTKPAQGDVMQARWGTHGDHPIVALAPWNVAECFHLTVLAVNISERLRMPVILLLDEIIGHMREVVSFPEKVDLYQAPKPTKGPDEFLLYGDDTNYDGPVMTFGEGYRIHISGLTHRKDGFPTNDAETIGWKMARLKRKIDDNKHWLWDFFYTDLGSETIIVCYGSTARSALETKRIYEKKTGKSIGVVRLRMIWPFPYDRLTALLRSAKRIIVPEMNQGQLNNEVERAVSPDVPVQPVNRVDGEMLTAEEILNVIG